MPTIAKHFKFASKKNDYGNKSAEIKDCEDEREEKTTMSVVKMRSQRSNRNVEKLVAPLVRRKIKDFLRQRSTKIGTSDCTTAIPTGDTCVKFVRCFQRSQEYLPKAVPEVTIQQEY